ncbi:enoyl-CoA delta isomerase 1, peroxisomal-like [Malania oleifera]|uniref:enoyl-CoA delta isomerase 1, peroxisomal-like n=1 Tax=Malania oleifera TaxID=397392 RepID=UPI0025AE1256|nr:enoyl-CoA delta isomerase 1, peroxisomal-like [Malania oleifera]
MCSLRRQGNIFVLTLTGAGEHRLNPTLIDAIKSSLLRVRAALPPPSVLITTAHGKFFSNGYDLAWSKSPDPVESDARGRLMVAKFKALVADFLSLPMPTIAAVNGHASAAGFVLALSHDYVLMRKDRGFLYMSELDIGLVIPRWFTAVIRCKIGSAAARRDVLLRSKKVTAEEAVAEGIVFSAHDGAEETLRAAVRLGEELEGRRWDGHVYGEIRMGLYSEIPEAIRLDGEMSGTASRL